MRWLFHWTAECFADYEACRVCAEHLDDLTPQRMFDIFARDLRARGVRLPASSDPLTDPEFRATILANYSIVSPRNYPPEAPVADRMAA